LFCNTAIPTEAHEGGKVVRPTYQPCLPPPPTPPGETLGTHSC